MSMREVVAQIPVLKASYVTGRPFTLPVNITVSTSYRCNSRCTNSHSSGKVSTLKLEMTVCTPSVKFL